MYIGRKLDTLETVPLQDWSMNELLYHHDLMSNAVHYLNAEGVSFHGNIIKEIETRGGVPHDRGGWDHSSRVIYD
ncbi:hypothetical protein PP175_05050 [Aneurinibacillus sp. Ricciae_BoGa-3]|uniref:hypothetical protein n=1 Tax=Aneurinibacillus sp. Ricciae_BoGa-3 TaxID=3022697 RepID=UPI002340C074|nr:hypothetical protein [Aneurinibacillus sp. Ricciae_BoGa-3]WCK55345.1 hypothetical protein PP175_05050 [Aneurinibacillus sp. Ricciae_BoGa-3]